MEYGLPVGNYYRDFNFVKRCLLGSPSLFAPDFLVPRKYVRNERKSSRLGNSTAEFSTIFKLGLWLWLGLMLALRVRVRVTARGTARVNVKVRG